MSPAEHPAVTPEHPVVACWGGADSSGAVQLGALLASRLGQPLELVGAYRYEPLALSARVTLPAEDEARFEAARAGVARARRLVDASLDVRERVVPAEGIARAVVDAARETDACLLVLGRDLSGTVTRDVIQHATCPVAVSPLSVPLPGEDELRRIAVAFDGSPPARYALIAAEHLARATGGSVHQQSLAGDAGAALVAASEEFDVLLCGSRGRGRLASTVLGSVSSQLVHGAHCPVIVIPRGVRRSSKAPLGLTTAAAH
ncbi:universal stress protein [Baekduia soli]|nr:universal stress protein [Baekduia soli]